MKKTAIIFILLIFSASFLIAEEQNQTCDPNSFTNLEIMTQDLENPAIGLSTGYTYRTMSGDKTVKLNIYVFEEPAVSAELKFELITDDDRLLRAYGSIGAYVFFYEFHLSTISMGVSLTAGLRLNLTDSLFIYGELVAMEGPGQYDLEEQPGYFYMGTLYSDYFPFFPRMGVSLSL